MGVHLPWGGYYAIKDASSLGIESMRSARYVNDKKGLHTNYMSVGNLISAIRITPNNKPVGAEWKGAIEDDFNARNKA